MMNPLSYFGVNSTMRLLILVICGTIAAASASDGELCFDKTKAAQLEKLTKIWKLIEKKVTACDDDEAILDLHEMLPVAEYMMQIVGLKKDAKCILGSDSLSTLFGKLYIQFAKCRKDYSYYEENKLRRLRRPVAEKRCNESLAELKKVISETDSVLSARIKIIKKKFGLITLNKTEMKKTQASTESKKPTRAAPLKSVDTSQIEKAAHSKYTAIKTQNDLKKRKDAKRKVSGEEKPKEADWQRELREKQEKKKRKAAAKAAAAKAAEAQTATATKSATASVPTVPAASGSTSTRPAPKTPTTKGAFCETPVAAPKPAPQKRKLSRSHSQNMSKVPIRATPVTRVHPSSPRQSQHIMHPAGSKHSTSSSVSEPARKKSNSMERLKNAPTTQMPAEKQSKQQLLSELPKHKKWVNDDDAKYCKNLKDCLQAKRKNRTSTKFGMFTWKHHCRSCGDIFCDDCSMKRAKVQSFPDKERVCNNCWKNYAGN